MLACLATVCWHRQWQHLNKIDFPFGPIKLFTQNDNCPHLSSLPLDFVSSSDRRPFVWVCVCLCVCLFVCLLVCVLAGTWGINKNLLINVQFNFVLLLISGSALASHCRQCRPLNFATSHMDFISFMSSFFSPSLSVYLSFSCWYSFLFFFVALVLFRFIARDSRLQHFSHFGGFFFSNAL